ncbi:MAG: ATP-binding protein [Armatimonadota bacterium]
MDSLGTYRPSFELPAGASRRGVMVIDIDHCIVSTDGSFFDLLGVSPEDLIDKNVEDAAQSTLKWRFEESDKYEASWQWLRNHPGEVLDEVLHLSGPDGRVLHRYSAPVLGEGQNRVGRIEIYSDITKRRELESAVRRAYDELKVAQDQLVQSEKLRAVGEIASGVAHDFNNMLGIILGNLQLLLRTTDDGNVRTRLQSAERAALDAAETVRRIREFTQQNRQEPSTVIDLSVIASEAIEMMRPSLQNSAKNIEISLDAAEGALTLGCEAEIREVLINIILNASQAMPDGGSISVNAGVSKSSVWARVADTGIGMSEDVRKRIFDPFFTTRGIEGTGLGMSVAYGIIKRHGGSISVDSEPGKGTAVTVFLPAAAGASDEKPGDQPVEIVSLSPARILVVDDEEMFAEVIVEMLSECGHAVCSARSGVDAIEQFRETPFDLVLTDLGMPEMSGWQVAKSIKDIEPQTPVVLLTGWGTTVDKSELDSSQVDIVLSKPVRMEELSSAVTEMLGRQMSRKAGSSS